MTNKTEENYFSSSDVAEKYRVSQRTVQRWIKNGMLPGAKKKGPFSKSDYEIPQSALDHLDTLINPSDD